MGLKIVSWNVNGIRSLSKGVATVLKELDADIICFQETKISKEMMTEELAIVDGYRSYFGHCRTRAGYSGVVTYCKKDVQPIAATDCLTAPLGNEELTLENFTLAPEILHSLDREGRAVITQHQLKTPVNSKSTLTIFNLYCPCVTGDIDGREQFRLQFLQLLEERVKQIQETSLIVVTGDINLPHRIIDLCDAVEKDVFLNEPHRIWFDHFVGVDGYVIDTFRFLYPEKRFAYTCWNTKTGARQTNSGARIDYVLLDKDLKQLLVDAAVHSKYMGSDHCPVSASSQIDLIPSAAPPPLCTSYRYRKRQQKLTMFLKKSCEKNVFDSIPATEEVSKKKVKLNPDGSKKLSDYFK